MANYDKSEEYELLPHKEIEELKDELRKLKEFEITPSKKMHVTMIELNHKLDKLITIFEDAMHEVRVEEGGLSFAEKMKPVVSKMNKILEQNSEIASGILAVADMLKGKQTEPSYQEEPELPSFAPEGPSPPPMPPAAPGPPSGRAPGPAPPAQAAEPRSAPPLPPPPRKRNFGL